MKDILYHDYANWLIEKSNLFEALKSIDSILLERYKYASDVMSHLYQKKIDTKTLDEDEESIFSFGFYYLFEEFEQISILLENTYIGNIEKFNENVDTIILYLNAIDFEEEIFITFEDIDKTKPIVDLEKEILSFFEKQEQAPKEMYEKFDEVSMKVFSDLKIDFYPVNEIFFDIADEMGLI